MISIPGTDEWVWTQMILGDRSLDFLTAHNVSSNYIIRILSQIAWTDNNLSNLLTEVHLYLQVIAFLPVNLLYLMESIHKDFICCLFLLLLFLVSLLIKHMKEDGQVFLLTFFKAGKIKYGKDMYRLTYIKESSLLTKTEISI